MDHHPKEVRDVWGGYFVAGAVPLALHGHKSSMIVVTNDVNAEVTGTPGATRFSVAEMRK
jgi:hypothetical protein